MTQEITVTGSFIWTLDDVKIRQAVLDGKPVTIQGKIFVYTIGFVFLVGLLTQISMSGKINLRSLITDPYLVTVTLGGFVILYLLFSFTQNANLKKGFLQSPDSNKRIDVVFTQDEIIMKAEGIYENKWKWNMIKEVQQNPKGFCFYFAERSGFWIPIRAFQPQEDVNTIAELAKRLTPKFKVLG